ncbi:SDR family NAD(P)-dependent oxidoreductase [Nonomuraea diastatica]|uniref:SDR family oxidoreductase n=1 Tax=Nonomuraea diastatica TaxID=1848329 RepID=A0A4R4W4M4_9ACTN|nr:SDR family oxidoreductase [Nonomuraea diastatica]TDD08020.1 SDR family oxidoreductase [Nonomuraea diastatica]
MTDAAAYTMTKAAVEALSRSLALTVGPRGITVNCVLPGVVDTDMSVGVTGNPAATAAVTGITALGRLGQPDDVADVVTFLTSDQARWITGQALDVTGGMWLGPSR